MRSAYLGLGANLGRRAQALAEALQLLDAHPGLALREVSSVYDTAPVGVTDQPRFLNLVARFDCRLSPEELLALAKDVERRLGRRPTRRWGPRPIDVDILLLDGLRLSSAQLTVPHPELTSRQFVLVPLAEIAPDLVLPDGQPVAELARPESALVRRVGSLDEAVAAEGVGAGGDA
ncbi:MAG: 2-amino-4-hydroxy-6-hydroxymethyldihydropteridine diphosphokinase [Armatimonadota bacterium]